MKQISGEILYVNRDVHDVTTTGGWGGGNHAVAAISKRLVGRDPKTGSKTGFLHDPMSGLRQLPVVDQLKIAKNVLLMGINPEGVHIGLSDVIARLDHDRDDVANKGQRFFLRVNDCSERNNSTVDHHIKNAVPYINGGFIFVSNWMKNWFETKFDDDGYIYKVGSNDPIVIKNGVDNTIFHPYVRRNNNKVRIVSHHWSDNQKKTSDITWKVAQFCSQNPDKYQFTFIGRTKLPLSELNPLGVTHILPCHGTELAMHLSDNDVYFSESKFDPGPNHCIEAIACGLPTYVHKDGGGCVEFAGSDHQYSSVSDLIDLIKTGNFQPNSEGIKLRSWSEFTDDVFEYMDLNE